MSSSTRASSSVTLGPCSSGRSPINLSRDDLHNSIRAAAGWIGPWPQIRVPLRANSAVLRITTCLQHGLIGVSRAVLLAIAACAEEVQRKTPVLLIGEPGVELEAAARCIYRSAKPPLPILRCAGLTEDAVSGGWPSRIVQDALVNNRAILLTDIECASPAAQRKLVDEIEAHRAFLRVFATTHKSIDSLQCMAEEGHLLPELLRLLCVEGREIEVPPLFLRPEDVPLLFYYYVQRFRVGYYGAPRGKVKGIDPMLLYFAAGLRWRGNLGELERFVVHASRAAARTDGWLSVKPGGDSESPTWPTECPFVLSLPAFVQAMKSRPELLHTIPIEDLPGYDLRGLLEGVDDHSDSADRGRWTIEARRRYLKTERAGPLQEGASYREAAVLSEEPEGEAEPRQVTSGDSRGGRLGIPPGTKWSEIKIRFKDGHTVSIMIGGKFKRICHYSEMGMGKKSSDPTVQWELLHAFAIGHGTLTWDNSFADKKNQKRRERLARDLRAIFGVESDPIEFIQGDGWRTRFQIEPA